MHKYVIAAVGVFVALMVASCNNVVENTNIPYASVSFVIDVSSTGADNSLRYDMMGNSKVYSKSSPAVCSAGYGYYGNSGVVVVRGIDNGLYAFDMCCPYEAKPAIALKSDGFFLNCPNCGSQFSIGNGSGYVNKGPAVQPLKRYNVYGLSGEKYRVVN